MIVGTKFCIFGPIRRNIKHKYIVPAKNSHLKVSGGGKGKLQSEQYIPHKEREREREEEERERERCMELGGGGRGRMRGRE